MAKIDESIREIADEVAPAAEDAARRAGSKLSGAFADVGDSVSDAASRLKHSARSAAAGSREYAADTLHGIASSARDIAERLRNVKDEGSNRTAEYAKLASEQLDRLSGKLLMLDASAATERARKVVRERPALTIGAAVIAGFALARLLKGRGVD